MNIGLFGDSFAEDHIFAREMIHEQDLGLGFDKNQEIIKLVRKKIPAWWDYLEDYGYSIDASYGHGGSDIQYSFRNFLTNHHRYDTNIFVVTHPGRISVPYKKKKKQKHFDWVHGTNAEVATMHKKERLGLGDKIGAEIADGLFNYHMKVGYHNNSRDYIFASLMIEKILSLRPDTKMINAFENWSPMIPSIPKTKTLFEIHQIENRLMNLGTNKTYPTFNEKYDMRIAHMTPASSETLAHDVNRLIQSGQTWLDFDLQPYECNKINQDDWFISDKQLKGWIKHTLGIDFSRI